MKKILLIALTGAFLLTASTASALEVQFRTGPSFDAKNWIGTQYKIGVNLAGTSKGAESGFYSSTTIDLGVMQGATVIWLTPEFQYDFKIGGLPLYIYPKMGLDMFFAFAGDAKSFGFGIKPALGAKFDFLEWFYVWCEPFALNVIFAQYAWISGGGVVGFATNGGWIKDTVMTYDLMFGVGFRL